MKKIIPYGNSTELVGTFSQNTKIVQSFIAEHTELLEISIQFGTYRKANKGTLVLNLFEADINSLIKTVKLNSAQLLDNLYAVFSINASVIAGKRYYFMLTCLCSPGDTITAKYGEKRHKTEIFKIDGNNTNGELDCYFTYEDGVPTQLISPQETVIESTPYTLGMIDVIIPTYNSTKFIDATISSIKSQLYNCTNIIIVDDGSKDFDELSNIVKTHASDVKITLTKNAKNKGAPFSRNTGASMSSGEFIFFCDSDIVLEKTIFMKMLQVFHTKNTPNLAWVYCNYKLGNKELVFNEFDAHKLKRANFCSTMSLIKRKHFKGFNESLKRFQDWDLFLKMSKAGFIGAWINESLFYAEDRSNGITNNTLSWADGVAELKRIHSDLQA